MVINCFQVIAVGFRLVGRFVRNILLFSGQISKIILCFVVLMKSQGNSDTENSLPIYLVLLPLNDIVREHNHPPGTLTFLFTIKIFHYQFINYHILNILRQYKVIFVGQQVQIASSGSSGNPPLSQKNMKSFIFNNKVLYDISMHVQIMQCFKVISSSIML